MNMHFLTRLDLTSQLPLEEVLVIIANLANNISNDNGNEPTTTISDHARKLRLNTGFSNE